MKKLALMLSMVGVVTFSLTSCGREEEPAIEQTFTVKLAENESYTFVLPKNKRDDAYEFTSQASHYAISTLGKNASGEQIYQYTPAQNYTGTDQVVVNNDWERNEDHHGQCTHPGGPHPGGNCTGGNCMGSNGGEEDHYIVTINFEVGRTVTTTSK